MVRSGGLGRRALLGGAAVAAAGAPVPAQAADSVVVATWAGEFGQLLAYAVDNALLKPLDILVTQELIDPSIRIAKMIAERAMGRGTLDVVFLDDVQAADMAARGLWEPLSQIDVPRLPDVYPVLRVPYAIPHVFSGLVIAYNPSFAIPAPTSFADLWDPRFRNRIGFADSLDVYNVAAASISHGGSMSDFAPGLAALRDLRKLGAQSFATNDELANAFRTGAVWIAPMWLARVAYWQRLRIDVQTAYPSEGAILYVITAGVPANAPDKPTAKRYVNALLDPAVQANFAIRLFYAPSVSNARLTGEVERAVSFTGDQRSRLRRLDYEYLNRNRAAVRDFWRTEYRSLG